MIGPPLNSHRVVGNLAAVLYEKIMKKTTDVDTNITPGSISRLLSTSFKMRTFFFRKMGNIETEGTVKLT